LKAQRAIRFMRTSPWIKGSEVLWQTWLTTCCNLPDDGIEDGLVLHNAELHLL